MAVKLKPVDLSKQPYGSIKRELDDIIGWFEGEKFDLDEAEMKYARGVAIITELNTRLSTAKLKVDKVKIDVPD